MNTPGPIFLVDVLQVTSDYLDLRRADAVRQLGAETVAAAEFEQQLGDEIVSMLSPDDRDLYYGEYVSDAEAAAADERAVASPGANLAAAEDHFDDRVVERFGNMQEYHLGVVASGLVLLNSEMIVVNRNPSYTILRVDTSDADNGPYRKRHFHGREQYELPLEDADYDLLVAAVHRLQLITTELRSQQ